MDRSPVRIRQLSAVSVHRPLALVGASLLAAALLCPLGCSASAGNGDTGVDGGVDAGTDLGIDASPPGCPAADDNGALYFDGIDQYVTMGAAPDLGLSQFTVEAWVRRDGPGKDMGTGAGGLHLVPIAGKGRGEKDGSNLDCNYAFGFSDDVLGADFEDMATGANHPITGNTAILFGEWHHVAVSYDGSTWRLYVDGALDAQAKVDAAPRADSIQHFGIGASFNSMGVPAGAFLGAIDEVRVWDHARTEAEISASMYNEIPTGEGLVGRWSLDPADGAPDSAGNDPGTISGAISVATKDAAPLKGCATAAAR